ncbi:MAG: hypothetical protein GC185_10900 [Alphaproteobacteria bacterium]|nr:hypothetical protein [Alphaproteobacteria bacterium]
MSFEYRRQLPKTNAALRRSLYDGDIYVLPANAATKAYVRAAKNRLMRAFDGPESVEALHEDCPQEDFLPAYQWLKQAVAEPGFGATHVARVAESLGFSAKNLSWDPVRFRIALHEGFLNEQAKAAYAVHRDTWYANPQSQVNVWVPLFDIRPTQGFFFYPEYFGKPVKNSSGVFDYGVWRESTGFGVAKGRTPNALYPAATRKVPEKKAVSFECGAGDMVIFSAAHLHGNCRNLSGLTRFSVDFRIVHRGDEKAGRGAPNVDNLSRGSTLQDYLRL